MTFFKDKKRGSLVPGASRDEHKQERAQLKHASRVPPYARLVSVIVFYCASGTFLTLVNKLAMAQFPFPNAVITLQNAG